MSCATFFAAALAIFPNVALAKSVELSRPVVGGCLEESGIDMVVYYLDRDGHFEVVVTYALKTDPTDTKRIRLNLSEGDTFGLHLPGARDVLFAFLRDGNTVSVTAKPKYTDRLQKEAATLRLREMLWNAFFGPTWGESQLTETL